MISRRDGVSVAGTVWTTTQQTSIPFEMRCPTTGKDGYWAHVNMSTFRHFNLLRTPASAAFSWFCRRLRCLNLLTFVEKAAFCIRGRTWRFYDVQEKVKCGTANVSLELYAGQHYNSRSHSCPVTYPTIRHLIYDRINSYHVSDILTLTMECAFIHTVQSCGLRRTGSCDNKFQATRQLTVAGRASSWAVSDCGALVSERWRQTDCGKTPVLSVSQTIRSRCSQRYRNHVGDVAKYCRPVATAVFIQMGSRLFFCRKEGVNSLAWNCWPA